MPSAPRGVGCWPGVGQKIQLCHLHGQPSADVWFQPTRIQTLHHLARIPPTVPPSFAPSPLAQAAPALRCSEDPPGSTFSGTWLQKIKERLLLGLNNSSHTPFFYILIAWGQDKSSWGEGIENRNSRLTFACHFLCTGSFVYIISDI